MIKADLAIIGGGAGGLTLAAGASQLGASVVLIEAAKMGGDCLHHGCIPSKTLIAASKHAGKVGYSPKAFAAVMAKVKAAIATIAPHDSSDRFESLGCRVLSGKASFVNPHTLAIDDQRVKARTIVIATGAAPFIPPIQGLVEAMPLSYQTVFDLKAPPKRLSVIGGGPIGCELAQAFARLGVTVSLLDHGQLLQRDDADGVAVVRDAMLAQGIKIYEHAAIDSVAGLAERKVIVFHHHGEEQILNTDLILVATGRRPCLDALKLDNAGVMASSRGIAVDAHCRTNQKHIYAIGDVCDGPQFTHWANHQAGVVLKHALLRLPAKIQPWTLPWVTYTDPEIAQVGMTEQQARAQDPSVTVLETCYPAVDRAVTDGIDTGKIKVIANRRGRVLGATIVGAMAGELIMPWVMLIQQRQTLRRLTEVMVAYPTLSELHKRVAQQFYQPKVFSPLVRRLVRLLKR